MSVIRDCQLDIMLFLIGVCAVLSFTIMFVNVLSSKRRTILVLMSSMSVFLLVFERFAYIYRGDVSACGFYMVRVSNGLVFFLLLFIPFLVSQYLKDIYETEGCLQQHDITLEIANIIFLIGTILLVVSQFTGMYYTFDDYNVYQRGIAFFLVYIPPLLIVLLQIVSLVRKRFALPKRLFWATLASLVLPIAASIIQFFFYGISWTCMVTALIVGIYYIYTMITVNAAVQKAQKQEIEFYKQAQKIESAMFEQTVEVLVSAVDAKDIRTSGHSTRVALYSRQIAERAGLSKEDCQKLYFSALLHDIGKIGIPDSIINKPDKLTDEEYELIKSHTVMGDKILSNIKQSPYLAIGARYHHERYDGKGYPDGLSGEIIPEFARIIAVADSYDVMTSQRSYNEVRSTDYAKQELKNGSGTQFDPRFAAIMIELLENGQIDTPAKIQETNK